MAAAALGATPTNAVAASPAIVAVGKDGGQATTRPESAKVAPTEKPKAATPAKPKTAPTAKPKPKAAAPAKRKVTKVKGSRGVRLGRTSSPKR